MTTSVQSNPLYYSLSTSFSDSPVTSSSSVRTVILQRDSTQKSFGIFIGEDIPNGLYVVTVERDSPADRARIQPGDRVLAVNDQYVSTMRGNPKQNLLNAASQALTLTLVIQSTDILRTLNIPLHNSDYNKNKDTQLPTSQTTLNTTSDLESYLKSIFDNKDIQIIPSSSVPHEFVISSNQRNAQLAPQWNSLPVSNQVKQAETKNNNDDYHRHRHRHHRHHRHHQPRPHPNKVLLETKETQTSLDEEDVFLDESEPTSSSFTMTPTTSITQPSMGTQQRILRSQQNDSNRNSTDDASHQKPTASNEQSVPTPSITRSSTTSTSSGERHFRITSARDPQPTATPAVKNANPSPRMPEIVLQAMKVNNAQNQEMNTSTNPPPIRITPSTEKMSTLPIPDARASEKEGKYNVTEAENKRYGSQQTINSAVSTPRSLRGGKRKVTLKRSKEFQGYGFHLQYNKSYYLVHRIEPNSPASDGGLVASDVILAMNNEPTSKMPHAYFVRLVGDSNEVTFIVQPLNEYLLENPTAPPPRVSNKTTENNDAPPITPQTENASSKIKNGLSQAFKKMGTNR